MLPKELLQYAAIPYRRRHKTEVMLVTSRETKRWVIPKGWPNKGTKPHDSAALEALEEAGVIGRTNANAIGVYYYKKRLKTGIGVRCKVEVFTLEVRKQRKRWLEKSERMTRWFEVDNAIDAVQEPGLRRLLRSIDNHV